MNRLVSWAAVLTLLPVAGTPGWSGKSSPILGGSSLSVRRAVAAIWLQGLPPYVERRVP